MEKGTLCINTFTAVMVSQKGYFPVGLRRDRFVGAAHKGVCSQA